MNHIIIGTAGHVDHGKTCLIKALTGIDTDRLEEEKKRGITIELGFAYLNLPDGSRAGIIDVPGHERFIKNMLAGAGGVDMALLVIAADEGVMPQTREHLGILSMLNIKSGIVALTKSDLVEPDWLEFVMEDVKTELAGTFLHDASIIPVSWATGEGIEILREEIFLRIRNVEPKNVSSSFRMPVDRVFTVKGFGTVVTGTLIEGALAVGDAVTIYPNEATSKVRNLQVHGQDVETAYAGQRVAVNLAAMKKDEVDRGDTLAQPDSMEPSMMLDVKLSVFSDTAREIENGSVLHLYHGTRNTLCKAILLDRDVLKAGESCYAQLRMSENIAVKSKDRYIVRFYSPIETIGGGEILESNPVKQKRFQQTMLDRLAIKERGTAGEKALLALLEHSPKFAPLGYIAKRRMMSINALQQELDQVKDPALLVKITDKVTVHADFWHTLEKELTTLLTQYHEKNPLQIGMRLDELKQRLLPDCDPTVADAALERFTLEKVIRTEWQRAAIFAFTVNMSAEQRRLADEIEATYRDAGLSVPELDELLARYPNQTAAVKQVIQSMVEQGTLINITAQIYLQRESFLRALDEMEKIQAECGVISLGDFRDRAGTSRKYALPILTYCDNKKLTKRTGDLRKLDESSVHRFRMMV
ncbi:MAG: selenocysteine-specific translation elongation factor [Eubacteriales bacterium]|nr:selenocysteine-specific translation elongation factor [Eubacteriales bacterium]